MKVFLLFALLCCFYSSWGAVVQLGICHLQGTDADSTITGSVKFTYLGPDEVQVEAIISGITVNTGAEHGMHIHQYGDISDAVASSSTGGHWNPANVPHACPNGTRHMGDMGLWTVQPDGSLNQTKVLDLIMLTGGTSIIGRAVVFHQNPDDCTTQPTGAAGNKLAHCVIGVADPGADTNAAVSNDATLTSAVCVLQSASASTASGLVVLTQDTPTSPVRIVAEINGITGTHGFHIHTWGDISSPTGQAVGGHYNPLGAHHAIPPFPVRHMGDLGNIHYYNTSVAYYDYTNDQLSLSGAYSIVGRPMILHSDEDDCTNPVGNAGSRIAQCVIGVKNPATVAPSLPFNVPTSQDTAACDGLYTLPATATATDEGSDTGSNVGSANVVALGLLAFALFVALF